MNDLLNIVLTVILNVPNKPDVNKEHSQFAMPLMKLCTHKLQKNRPLHP